MTVVDIWFVAAPRMPPSSHVEPQPCTLSNAEIERVGRMRDRTLAHEWMCFQQGFRNVLASYVDMRPAEIELGHLPCQSCHSDRHGAPIVVQDPGLRFSVSRTRGMAGIAVARGFRVGLDIERVRSVHPSLFSEDLLSAAEMISVGAAENPDSALLETWVKAEAALKASQSSIVSGISRHAAVGGGIAPDGFVAVGLTAPEGYVAAVAHAADVSATIRCRPSVERRSMSTWTPR